MNFETSYVPLATVVAAKIAYNYGRIFFRKIQKVFVFFLGLITL